MWFGVKNMRNERKRNIKYSLEICFLLIRIEPRYIPEYIEFWINENFFDQLSEYFYFISLGGAFSNF